MGEQNTDRPNTGLGHGEEPAEGQSQGAKTTEKGTNDIRSGAAHPHSGVIFGSSVTIETDNTCVYCQCIIDTESSSRFLPCNWPHGEESCVDAQRDEPINSATRGRVSLRNSKLEAQHGGGLYSVYIR